MTGGELRTRIKRALYVRPGMTADELRAATRVEPDDEGHLLHVLAEMVPNELARIHAVRGWIYCLRGLDG